MLRIFFSFNSISRRNKKLCIFLRGKGGGRGALSGHSDQIVQAIFYFILFFIFYFYLFVSKKFPRLLTPVGDVIFSPVAKATSKQPPTSKIIKRRGETMGKPLKIYEGSESFKAGKIYPEKKGERGKKKFTIQYN